VAFNVAVDLLPHISTQQNIGHHTRHIQISSSKTGTGAINELEKKMQMIRRVFRTSSLFLGLLVIAISFGIATVFLDSDVATAIVTAGATIFVSVFSAIWARNAEKTQAIEQQIREKKTPIYEEVITIAFDILWSGKQDQQPESTKNSSQRSKKGSSNREENSDPVDRLQKLTPQLIVWGTDEVIASWVHFRKVSANVKKEGAMEVMDAFEKFMFAIRQDLGHKNDLLKERDLLRIFINDLD